MRIVCQMVCWRSIYFGIDTMTLVGFQTTISLIGNKGQMVSLKLHISTKRSGTCSQMRRCMTSMSSLPDDMERPQLF